MENLGTIILAIGALGTAAFGIVDALKWTPVGTLGFGHIRSLLGAAVMNALKISYGPKYEEFLKAQYRMGRVSGELQRIVRQGARIGLTPETAEALAESVGTVGKSELQEVAKSLAKGPEKLSDEQSGILGRYELALDARIDAALALADSKYVGYMRLLASIVAVVIALIVARIQGVSLMTAVIVGVAAVPIAPMAKDVASALQSAAKAMPAKAR